MTAIAAPRNRVIEAAKVILNTLIEGLGVAAAVAFGQAALPILAAPIIRTIFKWIVEKVAEWIDKNLYYLAIKLTIRMQSHVRKDEYNEAIKPIVRGDATNEELERAKAAADALINRNR